MTELKLCILFIIGLCAILLGGCKKEGDTESPKIELVRPANCDSIRQGDFIRFKTIFTDNEELAKYAIEIKNNFTHISNAPTDQGCNFEADKTAFNPFKYAVVEDIQPGLKTYTAEFNIIIPEGTDTGDYLMVVYAQDQKGQQSWYSISLKFFNNDR